MNIDNLLGLANLLLETGQTLNLEELSIIKNSLLILKYENHFKNIYFWGIILGTENNYYIAFGYKKNCIVDKTYFYSTDLMQWLMLNKIARTSQINHSSFYFLSGDPISNLKTTTTCQNSEQIIEECFLSNIIATISYDSEIVPRGFLMKNVGTVIENNAFQGLSEENSQRLSSYFHYRTPNRKCNKIALVKRDFYHPIDFLDNIDTDIPKGCWVLNKNCSSNILTVKSLLWPGMTFFLKPNSSDFGFMYFGHGNKNIDLPFMI